MLPFEEYSKIPALVLAVLVLELSVIPQTPFAEDASYDKNGFIAAEDIVKFFGDDRGLRLDTSEKTVTTPPRVPVVAPPAAEPVRPKCAEKSVVLRAITFELNSSHLTPEAITQLEQVAIALQNENLRECPFRIEGHTDATGSSEYNQWLSQRRAERVRSYLLDETSLQSTQLTAAGFGEAQLVDKTEPRSAINRRVELVMTKY